MKTLTLLLLLAASPLLAGDKPLASGTTKAVYSEQLVIRGVATTMLLEVRDTATRAVFWVTAEGCVWEQFDAAKPAVKLHCASRPDVLRKIQDESRLNRPVVVPENARAVERLLEPCVTFTAYPTQTRCAGWEVSTLTPVWEPENYAPGLSGTFGNYAPGLSWTPAIVWESRDARSQHADNPLRKEIR